MFMYQFVIASLNSSLGSIITVLGRVTLSTTLKYRYSSAASVLSVDIMKLIDACGEVNKFIRIAIKQPSKAALREISITLNTVKDEARERLLIVIVIVNIVHSEQHMNIATMHQMVSPVMPISVISHIIVSELRNSSIVVLPFI